jgi:beta-alanine degradation protein BauB
VKKSKMISASLFFLLLFTMSISLSAQDPIKATGNVYKNVLLYNAQVRVLLVEFAPGEVAAWHQHPDKACIFFKMPLSALIICCL